MLDVPANDQSNAGEIGIWHGGYIFMFHGYVPLFVKSHFSFLEASSSPDELVEVAHHLGLRQLFLTDRDGVHGIVRAWVKARELGITLSVGSLVSICHRHLDADEIGKDERRERWIPGAPIRAETVSSLLLLCESREGYANLCQLLTLGRRRSIKGRSVLRWEEVAAHADGLLALWGGPESLLQSAIEPPAVEHAILKQAFGDRLYGLCLRHRVPEETRTEALLRDRAAAFGLPLVAAQEVRYASVARRPLHDVLTAIRHHTTVDRAGRLLAANAEHELKSGHAFAALFADDPGAVARTRVVAARCTFSMDELRYRYPSEDLPDGRTSMDQLRYLTFDGARSRYGNEIPDDVVAQLDKELALIDELDYPGYFLTMQEIVRTCRERGILAQGRGSAANSAVCFCLGITAVDPVRMGLLFERFLSRERAEPPDIDLDIAHERR